MDIFHINVLYICIVCLKRPKINEKEAKDGPFFEKKIVNEDFLKAISGHSGSHFNN